MSFFRPSINYYTSVSRHVRNSNILSTLLYNKLYNPIFIHNVLIKSNFPKFISSSSSSSSLQRTKKFRNFIFGTTGIIGGILFLEYYFDSRSLIHKYVILPILTTVTDAEKSHKFAVWAGKWKLTPKDRIPDDDKLAVTVFGKKITNPICLAAGFDKNGEAIDALFDLGFGYVEIGSVTPEPQPGNPKPRVFRLTHDKAIINRYGFNSDGHKMVEIRLRDRLRRFVLHKARLLQETFSLIKSSSLDDSLLLSDSLGINRSLKEGKLLAINLGKNKWSDPNSVDDYIKGIKRLGCYADILVINVSSPNTPGLRDLQRKEIFQKLLNEVVIARNELSNPRPALLVKIAPDLSDKELSDIADAVIRSNVDGIIVSNTTISRPETLQSGGLINEIGGLSGPPLKPLALNTLQKMYKLTKGKITLIGCGGISNAKDALEYAKAGATLVQLYTSLSYDGAGKVREIKDELIKDLKDQKWSDIIGNE